MRLEELSITNYKNIDSKNFLFKEDIVCMVGDNGVGKSNILSSIYNYYVDGHNISRVQLNLNYRSNEVIVGITQRLNFYEEIMSFLDNSSNGWVSSSE